jgi:membrane associated rhomboid family serine protease
MVRNTLLDEFKNVWTKPNNGLIQIILINSIVFILINFLRVIFRISQYGDAYDWMINQIALPSSIGGFLLKPWTLITYFFTHENFFHILFNMLFLYWFGKIILDLLGNKKLINLYVLGGIIGGLFYILVYNLVPYYHDRVEQSILLGASAGVFAVVVGSATYFPNYSLFLMFFGPVKIKYIAIFYVMLSFFRIDGSNAGGEVAHLGGAAIGFFYMIQLKKGNDIGHPLETVLNWIKGLFSLQPKIRVSYKKPRAETPQNEKPGMQKVTQEEIDRILDKISQGGYENLSKEEKQKLFDASRK